MRRFPRLERQEERRGNVLAPVSGEIDTDKTQKLRARGTPAEGVPHPEQLPQDRD